MITLTLNTDQNQNSIHNQSARAKLCYLKMTRTENWTLDIA